MHVSKEYSLCFCKDGNVLWSLRTFEATLEEEGGRHERNFKLASCQALPSLWHSASTFIPMAMFHLFYPKWEKANQPQL